MIKSIEEGRKEDGNRSIADKIIKRLHDLEKTVQHNHGRWAWELLQNAKDSVVETERKVSVRVLYDTDKIEFSHNGDHFTEKDIRGLINQISSKEVDEGQVSKKTGRFGTGFLTTHLLSKKIDIKGIVETDDGILYQFEFPLDRNGKTTTLLIPNIEDAWYQFHLSTEGNQIMEYERDAFNTSFTYKLDSDEQKEIAKIGFIEFTNLIPYVLAFIPELFLVEIINNVNEETVIYQSDSNISDGIKHIIKNNNGKQSVEKLLYRTNGRVAIASRIESKGDSYDIQEIDNIPKLFCDFPLIGTENFHFPVVINSFFFHPQTERDGIWLKGESDLEVIENKELLIQAFDLYQDLVNEIENGPFKNIFNIANTKLPATDEKYFDILWYTKNLQLPIRHFLINKNVVESEDGEYNSLGNLRFPLKSYTKETREKIWKYTSDLYPKDVCAKVDLHQWTDLIWDDVSKLTFAGLVDDVKGFKSIGELSACLQKDETKTFEWLNEVASFLMDDETNLPLFEKNALIPNKNGFFLPKSSLFIDKIKDSSLIEILQLLGEDWNNILLHDKVAFGRYQTKEKKDIAARINEKLKNISNQNANFIKAISLLSEWFDNNPDEGKEFFSETYRKRAELFMNTIEDKDSLYKVMRSKTDLAHLSKVAEAIEDNPRLFENIEQAKDIYSLLRQYNINDLDKLREVLNNKIGDRRDPKSSLLPVTEEILANMGISSLEEWQEAIKDKDLAAQFSHESTPSTDMFVYVHTLIKRAKENIIAYLSTLEEYNLDELDDTTATTVLAGILKDGKPISIVARPAYNHQVIIYYGSERDILDYEPSELWVDDGIKPRMISLGHLLKMAQIVKFPI